MCCGGAAIGQTPSQPPVPYQPSGPSSGNAAAIQPKPTAPSQQIQQLIEKLGAEQFQQREAASAALLEIGEPALLPLATAERGKDAEVSSRAKAIRERIERERFEAISLRFKRDPDPTANYDLPGWKSFAAAAGTSRPAKRLFLEMLEQRHIIAMCLESLSGGQVPEGVFDGLPKIARQVAGGGRQDVYGDSPKLVVGRKRA